MYKVYRTYGIYDEEGEKLLEQRNQFIGGVTKVSHVAFLITDYVKIEYDRLEYPSSDVLVKGRSIDIRVKETGFDIIHGEGD